MDVVRIALLSSPRSGNTWLRQMLAQVLDLSEQAVHRPEQVCWQALPERYILQLHWPPEPAFLSQLQEHGFRSVVLARHPLDVLISILAFCQHNATDDWLGGAGGDERRLAASSPLSEEFVDYATGPRASALLAVSAGWWQLADVCRLRYEDLCLDAAGQMSALLSALKLVPRRALVEVIDGNSAENLRATPHCRREQAASRAEPGRIGPAGVAGVDRRGNENPLGVIDADERKLQQPAKALLGAQIRVIAPGDVG